MNLRTPAEKGSALLILLISGLAVLAISLAITRITLRHSRLTTAKSSEALAREESRSNVTRSMLNRFNEQLTDPDPSVKILQLRSTPRPILHFSSLSFHGVVQARESKLVAQNSNFDDMPRIDWPRLFAELSTDFGTDETCKAWRSEPGVSGAIQLESAVTCTAFPDNTPGALKANLTLAKPLSFTRLLEKTLTIAVTGRLQLKKLVVSNNSNLSLQFIAGGPIEIETLSVEANSRTQVLLHSSTGTSSVAHLVSAANLCSDPGSGKAEHVETGTSLRLEGPTGTSLDGVPSTAKAQGCDFERDPWLWHNAQGLGTQAG